MFQVDAHHHYWNPRRGDYGWLQDDAPLLSRPFLPRDLAPTLASHGIARTVVVQAAPTVEETEYLLGIADTTESVAAVVGWVDFEDPGHRRHLERLARHPKFSGVRPMIQDLPDESWMLREEIQWAYRALVDLDLTFDALGYPIHLDNFLTVFRRYPDLRAVIDHCMKPEIRAHGGARPVFEPWAKGMTRLAEETSAVCKLSGLVTEAAADWRVDDLRPFTDHILRVFGPTRVMWGSDWPVCRRRATYDAWRSAAEQLSAHLEPAARALVFGGTAARFYRIEA